MTRYLDLAEYLWLAEQVTGVDAAILASASRIELADSALHTPSAGFGDEDFYPDVIDKAAVLCCRLAWNHPLPDGNKRAAWAALVLHRQQRRAVGPGPTRCRRRRGRDDRCGRSRRRRGLDVRVATSARCLLSNQAIGQSGDQAIPSMIALRVALGRIAASAIAGTGW